MLRSIVLLIMFFSGVGTLPCLMFLIYCELQDQNEKLDKQRKKETSN